MNVVLIFPHGQVHTTLPLIPRQGDWFTWMRPPEVDTVTWVVERVEWYVDKEPWEPFVKLTLAPAPTE